MRFIHTADWQIGKPFARFGAKSEALRMARLDAIEAIGRLAAAESIAHVLVAGDIYDSAAPSRETLLQPKERMRAFSAVTWWLLPGNHDPHREGGLWSLFHAGGTPENVRLLLTPEPVALEDNCWLLPAPLTTKSESRDLTAAMDSAVTPEGAARVGLAHGSVVDFSGGDGDAGNPIDPRRAEKAGLFYLALGDWHRTQSIGARVWYAGTPEPDRHGSQTRGQALIVGVAGANADPKIEARATGAFEWRSASFALDNETRTDDLDAKLRADTPSLSKLVLNLTLSGATSLAARARIGDWIERLEASVCHLDCDESGLHVRPDAADLETIDFDGVLRRVAERLKTRMDDAALAAEERGIAEDALVTLYIETRRAAGGAAA